MGIRNRNLVREGLRRGRRRNKKQTKMFFKVLTSASLMSLSVLAAPQYAGVVPSHPVKTAPLTGSVQCRTEYATLWDTEYKETETEVCTTEYEKVCRTETQRLCQPTTRQECNTVYENQCSTVYKNVCVEQYKTEYEQKCVSVPRQECVTVPDQVCTNQPLQKCQDVPRQACQAVHKKVPVRVSRRVPKKICQDGHSEIDVPSPAISGPEIVDARNNENSLQFEKSQVEDIPSDNAIVFGN